MSGVSARVLRGCYEETAHLEFNLRTSDNRQSVVGDGGRAVAVSRPSHSTLRWTTNVMPPSTVVSICNDSWLNFLSLHFGEKIYR